jgi:hypothetical protein
MIFNLPAKIWRGNKMAMNSSDLRGVVQGKTIELEHAPGLPDGQSVLVTVKPVKSRLPPGEGIRRSAGAWSDDPQGLDRWLEEMQRSRQLDRPEIA